VVARTIIHIDQVSLTARIFAMGPTHTAPVRVPASEKPTSWQDNVRPPETSQKETLPVKQLAGLMAEGSRETLIIPAGSAGNGRDLQVVDELWISPLYRMPLMRIHDDPRHGRVVIRVTQFLAGEPDARLFQVPAGYKIDNSRSRVTRPDAALP
jgi:hypothetical protein